MSDLRITILENNFLSLSEQLEEIEDMIAETRYTLKEAYKDKDATLTEEDAYQMVADLLDE